MYVTCAKDARELSNFMNTIESVVNDALNSVESAAKNRKYHIGYSHDRKFIRNGGSLVAVKLRELGFDVDDSDTLDADGRCLRPIKISW